MKVDKLLKEDERILKDVVQSVNIVKTMNECFWIGDEKHKIGRASCRERV